MSSVIQTKHEKFDATADGRTDVSAADKFGPTLDWGLYYSNHWKYIDCDKLN